MTKKITKKTTKTLKNMSVKTIKTASNGQVITVKNADGDPYTTATILVQNKINYTPKVSVIIPVYNVEQYLRECLDSVVNQTLKEIEIICVDDGSTDGSLEILKEYAQKDNRITIITQENLHAGVARNAGLSVAKGEYLSFLDSDDFFELNLLEETYNQAKKENSDIVVYENSIYDDKTHKISSFIEINKKFINLSPLIPKMFGDDLFIFTNPNPWSKLFKRDLFIKNNLRYEKYLRCNDITCVCSALATAAKISVTNQSFVNYRSNQSDNVTANRTKNIDCFLYAIDKLEKKLKKLNLYATFKDAFKKRIKSSFNWELSTCSEQQKEIVKTIAQKILSRDLYNILYAPKVSVIIPVYNVEQYLRECLDSVVNQTLTEIEIICVNDGSTDGSLKVLKEYEVKDHRIKIINQKNQGLSCSRNNALKIANGEYIFFLDSDDWIREDSCEILYNHAKKLNLDIVNFEGIKYVEETKKLEEIPGLEIRYFQNENVFYTRKEIEPIIDKITISACLMFYKRSFIENNNLLFPAGLFFEDNVFVHTALNCVNNYGIKKTKLYYRRVHSEQTTQHWDRLYSHYIQIVNKIAEFYQKHTVFDKSTSNKIVNNFLIGAIYRWQSFTPYYKQKYISELYYSLIKTSKYFDITQNIKTFINNHHPMCFYSEILSHWYQTVKKEPLNLNTPKTYNEKLQWLKLYNSTPIKTKLSDKVLVRDWVTDKISQKYLVPIYGVYNSFDEIDFDKLPNQFVIKTNHGSGWNIIVTDKTKLDLAEAKEKLDRWMNDNYAFKWGAELHYRDIKPQIMIEKYIDPSESDHEIQIWCFSGKIKFVSVESIKDKQDLVRGTFYPDGTPTEFAISPNHYKKLDTITDRKAFNKAIKLAQKMLIDVPYVRIDFIEYHGDVRFREMTFTSGSGLSAIEPAKYNTVLGNWIKLPNKAYDLDTGMYYKLPKTPKVHKPFIIKPYALFPYYFLATMWMKVIKLPLLKYKRHLKQVLYSHSNRGRMEKIIQTIQSVQNNTDIQIKNIISEEKKQIESLRNQQNELSKTLNNKLSEQKQLFESKYSELNSNILKTSEKTEENKTDLMNRINFVSAKTMETFNTGTTELDHKIDSILSKTNSSIHSISEHFDNISNKAINNIEALKTDVLNLSNNIDNKKQDLQSDIKKINANNNNIETILSDTQDKINKLKENITESSNSLVSKLDESKKEINNNIEQDRMLYYNPYAVANLTELGLCGMTSAQDFENRFKKLISGLDSDSAETIVKIISRLQKIKGTNSKLDLFTTEEKTQLKKVREFNSEILKVSENLYAYKNHLLPINHFEPSVFLYNHGIDKLNSLDSFKNKDILDIGGFIGDSILMLSPLTNKKIFSFEATKENHDLMLKTIELNNIKNAVPVHSAVGDKNGEIELRFNGSASSQNDIMVKNPKYIEKSPLIKIDDYVREHNINVGLIKVDIEGAEQSFLRGARETITKYKPTLLISIYHNVDDFLDIKPMIESWNLGYKFKIFKPTIGSIESETLLICEQ